MPRAAVAITGLTQPRPGPCGGVDPAENGVRGPRLPPASLEQKEEGGSKAQPKPESALRWEKPSNFSVLGWFFL